jgi:hypothetical protein
VISGIGRKVDENYALLVYYVESTGNSLPTFRDEGSFKDIIGPIFKEAHENGTDSLSRNVVKELPLLAA